MKDLLTLPRCRSWALWSILAEALEQGLPVLVGVSEVHRAAFERFADGMPLALPPEEGAILDWFRETVERTSGDAHVAFSTRQEMPEGGSADGNG